MDNQPNTQPAKNPNTGNNNDENDTDGKDTEPKVYQDGGSSNNKHNNEPKH